MFGVGRDEEYSHFHVLLVAYKLRQAFWQRESLGISVHIL